MTGLTRNAFSSEQAQGSANKAAEDFGAPKTRALVEATFFAGLRKAGMPEE
jgi:hypothetical protein